MSANGVRAISPAVEHFEIPSLNGLRAVSFLLVFAGHSGAPWIPAGFGVTVFFFLSGYLITTLLRLEVARTGRVHFKLFYLRRVLRIWPPFYLVLLSGVALTLTGAIGGEIHGAPVSAQLLHVYNYWTILRDWKFVVIGSGVYWSLAVEEHFYLLFPALFVALHRAGCGPRSMRGSFLAICSLVLAWRCALVFALHAPASQTFVATDSRIDSILFGCCLAVWRNPALDAPRAVASPPGASAKLGALAALGVLLFTFAVRAEWFRETIRYSLQGLALTPLFSFVVSFPEWGPVRILNHRVLTFIGTLSYSMYLMHYTILESILWWFPSIDPVVRVVLALALSIVAAKLLYIFVEEPCAKLRRTLARRAQASVAREGQLA